MAIRKVDWGLLIVRFYTLNVIKPIEPIWSLFFGTTNPSYFTPLYYRNRYVVQENVVCFLIHDHELVFLAIPIKFFLTSSIYYCQCWGELPSINFWNSSFYYGQSKGLRWDIEHTQKVPVHQSLLLYFLKAFSNHVVILGFKTFTEIFYLITICVCRKLRMNAKTWTGAHSNLF